MYAIYNGSYWFMKNKYKNCIAIPMAGDHITFDDSGPRSIVKVDYEDSEGLIFKILIEDGTDTLPNRKGKMVHVLKLKETKINAVDDYTLYRGGRKIFPASLRYKVLNLFYLFFYKIKSFIKN